MPTISMFYGVIIRMYYDEHNPPHFHAVYGEYNGSFSILDLKMIEGDLPRKAQNLIIEWANKHKEEIINIWNTKTLKKLPPLD